MTFPRRRPHRRQDGRTPAFPGDFPDDDRDMTQVLGPHRGTVYDGARFEWGGASSIGLPDSDTPPASPAGDYRQAIAQANAEAGNPPGSGYHSGIGDATTWHPGQYPPRHPKSSEPHGPDMFPALPPGPPPVTVRHDPPAAPVGYEIIGRETAKGWPRLGELRCDYPAALAETPIPCDSVHRDGTALSFRDLRLSAQTAGWHMDRLGQWACPRCCQASPEYRGLYPVTVYDPLAAEAHVARDQRGVMAAWLEADGSAATTSYYQWVAAAGVETAARAAAELGLRDRTLDHHEASHALGRHAAATR